MWIDRFRFLLLALSLIASFSARVTAQDAAAGQSSDAALRAAVDAFVRDFNKHDAQAVANFWPNPSRIIQLAVNKDGIISGSMHNNSTDQSYVVQGCVDKQTQRVAFTIGDKSDTVFETGIYNLTQNQTPVLVHYGPKKTETDMLVRLNAPKDSGSSNQATSGNGANSSYEPAPAQSGESDSQ